MNKITRLFKGLLNVIKGEAKEIRELQPTEIDYEQGEVVATLTMIVLRSFGVPTATIEQKVIAKICAYVIRDIKDGVKSDDKLIIHRVMKELGKIKD